MGTERKETYFFRDTIDEKLRNNLPTKDIFSSGEPAFELNTNGGDILTEPPLINTETYILLKEKNKIKKKKKHEPTQRILPSSSIFQTKEETEKLNLEMNLRKNKKKKPVINKNKMMKFNVFGFFEELREPEQTLNSGVPIEKWFNPLFCNTEDRKRKVEIYFHFIRIFFKKYLGFFSAKIVDKIYTKRNTKSYQSGCVETIDQCQRNLSAIYT